MRRGLLFTSLTLLTIVTFGQTKNNYSLENPTLVFRPQEYLTMHNEYNSFPNEQDYLNIVTADDSKQKNYKRKTVILSSISIGLLAGLLIANETNNKDLAVGLTVGGLVTSSFGLYYTIKWDKQKKEKK